MKTGTAAWLGVLMLSVVACGGHISSAASHPSASPKSVASLGCRLPVAGFHPSGAKGQPDPSIAPDGQDNQHGTGGFLDLPAGTYTPASESDRSYLASSGVWVPATRQAISPDETFYVVGTQAISSPTSAPTTTLHLVDVRTKSKRTLFTAPDGDMAIVLAITPAGIYVETMFSGGPGPFTLQLIDPSTGAAHVVAGSAGKLDATSEPWMAVSPDAAWGMSISNGNTMNPTFTLVRLSLNDGRRTDWFSGPSPFSVVGFDRHNDPIVIEPLQASANLTIITGPGRSTTVKPQGGSFLAGRGTPVADGHGVWFGSADGSIWLYASDGSFKKVATVPPQAGATGELYDPHAWRSVAGPCV